MRILYYCPEYYFNHGGRIHARGFFGALEKLPEVSACFLYPGAGAQEAHQIDAEKQPARERLWFLPQSLRQIVRFFRPKYALTREVISEIVANQCDALVVRTGAGHPLIGAIKKACPDVVVCAEVNSAHFDEAFSRVPLRSLFQKWEVRGFDHADVITVVSTYLKSYLQNHGVAADKILVNQNGVDQFTAKHAGVTSAREQYNIPQDAFVIGYIGGMETFRKLPQVIDYVAELRRVGNDDIYLLMVGDGADMPAVKSAINSRHDVLGDTVKLVGWQDHANIPGFLASFDVAIFPFTNAYCSPLKLFEYLAAGLPVIGPDTSAVREVFQDEIHLKLVKQDGTDFIEKLLQIKNDPELGSRLGRAGQALVLEKYSWEKNAERVLTHIKSARSHITETS